jgi:hypothetical protein
MPRSARVRDPAPRHLALTRARAPWWSAVGLAGLLGAGCTQSALVGLNDKLHPDGGPGAVDGALHAHAVFDHVDSVLWLGGDADPSRIELFIFEVPATCEELSTRGWIDKVRPTDLMGVTVGGTKPGTYVVAPTTPPEAGAAYLHHVIDQTAMTIESIGDKGTVVITDVKPDETVSGTLEASFVTGADAVGSLQGEFTATWCPTGVGL